MDSIRVALGFSACFSVNRIGLSVVMLYLGMWIF